MSTPTVSTLSYTMTGIVTSVTLDTTGAAPRDVLLLVINGMSGQQTTLPTGWTVLVGDTVYGTRDAFIAVKPYAGEASVTATFNGTMSTIGAALISISGTDITALTAGTPGLRAVTGTSTTNVAPAVTVPADSLVLCVSLEATNAMESPNNIVGVTGGLAALLYAPQDVLDGHINTIWVGTLPVAQAGVVPAVTVTYENPQASNGWAVLLYATPTVLPQGIPVQTPAGTQYLTFLQAGQRVTPASVSIWLPGYPTIAAAIADQGRHPTVAHHGGDGSFPADSEYGIDRSIFLGVPVIEFSCGWTSDGVPFGLPATYVDSTGTVVTPDTTTMTWADVQAQLRNGDRPVAPGVYQPLMRFDDAAAKYGHLVSMIVDPKVKIADAPSIQTLMSICGSNGPESFAFKFDSPTTDTTMTGLVRPAGYPAFGYWGWAGDAPLIDSQQANWDVLGSSYNAASVPTAAQWAAVLAYGKPTWAAIIPDQPSVDMAVAAGAGMMMVSAVAAVTVISPR